MNVEAGYREALRIHAGTGSRKSEGMHRVDLALLLVALGRAEEARGQWRDGAAILGEIGAPELEAMTRAMRDECRRAGVTPFEGTARGVESAGIPPRPH